MQSPVKKIYITQVFGVNAANYAKFGLKGHNGIDYRAFLPNGERCYEGGKSEVFAPHDGKIIENMYDENGYGNYVKIENDNEGSILAHLSSASPRKTGDTVKMGELIGYQGTTGNSTGIHLHWGYYKQPRDRANGFNGYINQEGLYAPYGETASNTMTIEIAVFNKLHKNSTQWDKTSKEYLPENDPASTLFEDVQRVVSGYKSRATTLENERNQARIDLEKANTEIRNRVDQLANEREACQRTTTALNADISTKEKMIKTLTDAEGKHGAVVKELEGKLREAQAAIGKRDLQITDLQTKLEQCKKGVVVESIWVKLVKLFSTWKN